MKRVVFLVYTFLLLSLPTFASAVISIPYVVDYKDQVTFGDTAEISYADQTYIGLENYSQKYVGGFANLSYTYTHHACCYDNFPPLLYITQSDPISVPQIDGVIGHTYQFQQMNRGMGDETDLYFVEIQFDQSGYRITVKNSNGDEIENKYYSIPEITADSFVTLANRHPRSDPPGLNSMSFAPVKIKELATEPEHLINPVIIIPGIMGSAYSPLFNKLVIDPILHTYDNLIDTLEINGYIENKSLFTFPYEWRDSSVLNANLLKNKIIEVKQICTEVNIPDVNCNKVDVVAHSMGGLVAREYIQSDQYQNDIDQIIFLGVPHKGSPKSYLMWEAGETPLNFIDSLVKLKFSIEAAKNFYSSLFDYVRNRPIASVQELLPIFDYIKDKHTGVTRNYPNDYPRNLFLEALNINTHKLLSSGVRITNIVGDTGNNTIEKIRVVSLLGGDKWEHGIPDGFYENTNDNGLERGGGDETVTFIGSTLDESIENDIVNSNHINLPSVVQEKIIKIFTGKDPIGVVNHAIIRSMLVIQLHSPIDMVIIAPDGKKLGKDFITGQIYNEIPLAFYSGYQTDEEYVTIPDPLDGEYKIELQGVDQGGKYGVSTSYVSDDVLTTKEVVGLTSPGQITSVKVEFDDSNPENLSSEREVTPEILIEDINKSYDLGWIKDKKTREALIRQVNGAIKFNKKIEKIKERLSDGSVKERKIKKFSVKVNKILVKLLEKELEFLLKKDKITEEAYTLISNDIRYLNK